MLAAEAERCRDTQVPAEDAPPATQIAGNRLSLLEQQAATLCQQRALVNKRHTAFVALHEARPQSCLRQCILSSFRFEYARSHSPSHR